MRMYSLSAGMRRLNNQEVNLKFIADLHIHSRFSIATSSKLVPEYLEYWAMIKGINVIGTGDCLHPGWLKEIKEKLEPADNGLFRLKKEYKPDISAPDHPLIPDKVFFMLTGELSNIYKKDGKVRKVHNLCVFPDFEALEKVQQKLMRIGNIESDGRPILGLDSKILLEMVLESSAQSFLIPAHIWTPWFSVLGSKSGFNTIEECYEDLTPHIFALETGLSSDPPMNRACSFLDRFKLVSNSDAHSPEKLGREANLFDADLSYSGIYKSLSGSSGFTGTIEFFPQEGKYHYDGHRKCSICWDPLETLSHGGICPVCTKPVTKGVMYRVAELANRSGPGSLQDKKVFHSITSMPDLLAEIAGRKNCSSKAVQSEYFRLIEKLGPEFHILLDADIDGIRDSGGELIAEGIRRLRRGEVIITEGYDGEFGRIKVFGEGEVNSFSGISLFSPEGQIQDAGKSESSVRFNIDEFQALNRKTVKESKAGSSGSGFSSGQIQAIEHYKGPCMVLAGPGSGKTAVLTERIIYLVRQKSINPADILAITFSNKAAGEMKERLRRKTDYSDTSVSTFHAFGLSVLKKHYVKFERAEHFYISDGEECRDILNEIAVGKKREISGMLKSIGGFKHGLSGYDRPDILEAYDRELQKRDAFDLDDMIYQPVKLFIDYPEILEEYRRQFPWIMVDEYQDINARQYELIKLLAGPGSPDIFAIGDPDQSIYGFRGSDMQCMEQMKKDYPDTKIINIERSYRCPDPVMRIAGQILNRKEHLEGRKDKRRIHIQESETDKSEADWIAAQIEKMIGGVRSFSMDSGISDGESESASFSDFCVLCRTSLMFEPLIKAFADHGIAYQVIGTDPFYREEPFTSLISRFRRIYYHMINVKTSSLDSVAHEIRQMISGREKAGKILETMMTDMDIPDHSRKRIIQLAAPFGSDYEKFFLSLATGQGIDDFDVKAEAVSLMTIHASKGLEFNTVFIPGCEEGIIPFELFGNKSISELAEEERLFYVGVTRTRDNLYLTHAKKRIFKGRVLIQKRSRLIDRLEKKLLDLGARERKKKKEEEQLDLFS